MGIKEIYDILPAANWAESYPLGNGRIGAMVRGNTADEIISFNHDLLWRGCYEGPYYRTARDIERIKALCADGNYYEADRVIRETLPAQTGVYINPFVPFCDMYVTLLAGGGKTSDYIRTLRLCDGTALVSFESGGIVFQRECFCSLKYGVFAMKISAAKPVSLSGMISISRIKDAECSVEGRTDGKSLILNGQFDEGRSFSAAVRIINRGGRALAGRKAYSEESGDIPLSERRFGLGYVFDRDEYPGAEKGPSLIFDSCDEVIVFAALSTDHESDDPESFSLGLLESLPGYENMLEEHKRHFASVFGRTCLELSPETESVCLRDKISRLRKGTAPDAELIEACYNISRYLAISSGMPQPEGRTKKTPINLQGLWCRDTRPAWESDYHLDLNIQMCCWPLASAGLAEWYDPYISWLERLMPAAKRCAKGMYGCGGAAYNGCCDPWILGGTDNVGFGFIGAGPWLAQILWIAYEYSPSKELLGRIYRVMEPIAEFCRNMLISNEYGQLTYPFGSSPEMALKTDDGNVWIASASVCDLTLTKELFLHMSEAVRILGIDPGFDYSAAADKIQPVMTGNGIGEWTKPHAEAEPGHRHRSPFICFCPGNSITPERSPEIVSALRRLLDRRLESGNSMSTAFSYAWDAQILARFADGEKAMEKLGDLFRIHLLPNGMLTTNDSEGIGGIGWFKGVRVIQADASIEVISSVTEMICQDHNGYIDPLPALPENISQGKMTGLRCRGGFTADLEWLDRKLTYLKIHSALGGEISVRLQDGIHHIKTEAGNNYILITK